MSGVMWGGASGSEGFGLFRETAQKGWLHGGEVPEEREGHGGGWSVDCIPSARESCSLFLRITCSVEEVENRVLGQPFFSWFW